MCSLVLILKQLHAFRFDVSVEACYTHPSLICSRSTRGTVNVISNTCPTYSGVTEASIPANLRDGARAFTLRARDLDRDHFGVLSYDILGDSAAVRDFTIDTAGNVLTQPSYRSSGVSTYNIQIIVRDGSTVNPCFLAVNIVLNVERNRFRPEFSNSSVTRTILETHPLPDEILTLRVRAVV